MSRRPGGTVPLLEQGLHVYRTCSRATSALSDRKQCREDHISVSDREVKATRQEVTKVAESRAEPMQS